MTHEMVSRPLRTHDARSVLRPHSPARPRANRDDAEKSANKNSSSRVIVAAETVHAVCPWQDSNLRTRLRRPLLYPLSYRGSGEVNVTSFGEWVAKGLSGGRMGELCGSGHVVCVGGLTSLAW